MNSYKNILVKLSGFTKKYYTKRLIRGLLLFLVFGLLFFFITLGIEYILWLNSAGRLVLLLLFIAIEGYLLFKFILTPIFYLFKLKKGISNKQASLMIGKHFSRVDDKLYNLLDFAEDKNQSELLLASIEQRSLELDTVPFVNAVDLKENLKYAKYLILPALFFGLIWLSGNFTSFFSSTERIVNFDTAYTPPAPFSFQLLSNDLDVLNDKEYTIAVQTIGELKPEAVYIDIDGNKLLLSKVDGIYQHTLKPPFKSADFYFEANSVKSKRYRINALETPSIQNFELQLDYPSYLKRRPEVLRSTGNATFPEGTKVTWLITAQNTENISLIENDTAVELRKREQFFDWSKRVYSNYQYEIATSNNNVENYEKLAYEFKVVKDAFPTIKVTETRDSLNLNTFYYLGELSDDYGLSNIDLVYYTSEQPQNVQKLNLKELTNNFDRFYYTFPSGLNLDVGKDYSYYFEVTDNDAIHQGKKSKSQVFSTSLLNDVALKNKELESQQSIIKNLSKSLENYKEQKDKLNELNEEQKEKKSLNFNDQSQLKDFLKKQEQEEKMMQKFSKQLKENLEKNEDDDKLSELLKERLERQEIEAKKNEKLLEELNKIADKINKEDLKKKLEELGKNQQKSERNLEQLVELTKRYYVTEKASQLAKELKKLAEEQEKAAQEKLENEIEKQKELNEEFNKLSDELKELEKDNQDLKKPIDLSIDDSKQENTKKDQQQATEALEKEAQEPSESLEKQEAGNKQNAAAQKMKEMSEALEKSSSGGGGGSSITEDAEMLRQILDNLITFSFKQENLYDDLSTSDVDLPQFASSIRAQQELRELFEHVDDSLFALSLRRAELSEFVNEQITEVYYNTDKALELMAESQIYQGVGYQKYVISAANSLSDFLANLLDNMQESMQSGSSEGEGEGFQLPDIIKSQSELSEKMKGQGKGEKEGKEDQGQEGQGQKGDGKDGEGKNSGEGQAGNNGANGSLGKGENNQGKNGKGNNGQNGGKEGKGGQNGKEGKNRGAASQGQGSENNSSEEELQEIFEIYKEQQKIRQELEKQLADMINQGDRNLGKKLIRQMEDFENELLENGITQSGITKINTIKYELIKLQNAAMKQGEKKERESNTNQRDFENPILTKPLQLELDKNEIEILNRETLPLKQNYKNKVKHYFKEHD